MVRDSFTCGVCLELLKDPICCAVDTCNYMMCREHFQLEMQCPNRCNGEEPLMIVKVQRVILIQINNIQVKCHLCDMGYALGERETHFKVNCDGLMIE